MLCQYCGEEEATEKIGNPNVNISHNIDWSDEKNWWKVCKDCKQIIPLQIMSGIPDEKVQGYANKKLLEISKRTKKPIMNACIYKKEDGSYDSTSITFTGEEE